MITIRLGAPLVACALVATTGLVAVPGAAAQSNGSIRETAAAAAPAVSDALIEPARSPGRYVRNIDGSATDRTTMQSEGCADARTITDTARHVVVLDIGAQTVKKLPSPGVVLSATRIRLTYHQLVLALKGYLDGYAACRVRTATGKVTVAVATNTDGNFRNYRARSKATDWANHVVDRLRAHAAGTHIRVAGANDIEASFAATKRQVRAWIDEYLKHTPGRLIEIGSADGCPTKRGDDHRSCGAVRSSGPHDAPHIWTQADYYEIAHGLSPKRLRVLPQIYHAAQARQWANIATTGATATDHIAFLGPLTERAACGPDCSITPGHAWRTLLRNLSADRRTTPTSLPVAVDLRIS